MGRTPVVLYVSCPGDVVPFAAVLNSKLRIALGITEQVICKVVAGEGAVKAVCTLGRPEQVLDLFVNRPASSHLELVRTFGPGDIVADLVIVCLVLPRPARDFKVRAGGT